MRKLKLIWDFRGPNAEKTAQHHELHLKEYLKIEKVFCDNIGHKVINDMHATAYLIVNNSDMQKIRDDLKPHRGELYES